MAVFRSDLAAMRQMPDATGVDAEMTRDEILAHPKVQEVCSNLSDAKRDLLTACEQTSPGPFDQSVCADILAAARDYKRAWNTRNLAIADIVSKHGVVKA